MINTGIAVRLVFVMVVLNDDLEYSTEATSSVVCRSWTIVVVVIKELRTLSDSTVPSRKLSVLILCIHSCLHWSNIAISFLVSLKNRELTGDTHSLCANRQ